MAWRKTLGVSAALGTLILLTTAIHFAVTPPGRASVGHRVLRTTTSRRPSVVMVLMDDASYELLATMPQGRRMQAEGASYDNAYVVDSLCCSSRTSIFTGRPPHQTGVLTNTANDPNDPIGGYAAFARHGNAQRAFNLALQRSGYTTGFVGKYLNGYDFTMKHGKRVPPATIPGWNHFDAILAGGYPEWDFWRAHRDGTQPMRLSFDPKPPRSSPTDKLDSHYATNVESADAVRFVQQHRDDAAPYFLEVATYAPHAQLTKAYPDNPPFPPAFADRPPKGDPTGGNCGMKLCSQLSLHDLAGFGDSRADNRPTFLHRDGTTSPAPAWNVNPVTLKAKQALREYRNRSRMVQAVDRMIGRLRAAVGPDTYVVLTSDNGYHLGQLQLNGGKGTPYDFDTHVPLVVDGPGITPGTRHQFVSNIDLAPTFEKIAGVTPPSSVSGTSFLGSLQHRSARGSHYVFFDHTYAKSQPGEVDNDTAVGGDLEQVPSYIGVRGKQGLLARFDLDNSWTGHHYAYELYRYHRGFYEKTNVFARDHDQPWARELMKRLKAWDGCAPAQCRAAAS
jgi:arylsulfatase A-like enzyme